MSNWTSLLLALRVGLAGTGIAVALGLWIARVLQLRNVRAVGTKVLVSGLTLPPAIFCVYFLFRFTGRVFHWPWAVAATQLNAVPLLAWWILTCFERLDPRYENAARSLGASEWRIFWRIALPLEWRPILWGATMVLLRIFAEFVAVLVIARRLPS